MIDKLADSPKLKVIAYIALTVGLLASFWPRLDFGDVAGVNLKIPLSLMLCAVFVILKLPSVYRMRRLLFDSIGVRLFAIFWLISAFSLFRTDNLVRGVSEVLLLAGIGAVFLAIYVTFWSLFDKNQVKIIKVITASGLVLVCLLAIWQLLGDAWGVPTSLTLLPEAYTSKVFGFARPTGLALEPEFLGSLLLIPGLVLVREIIIGNRSWLYWLLTILATVTIGLTLSRGAYLAFLVGIIIICVVSKPAWQRYLKLAGVVLVSMVLTLGLMTLAAQINQRDNISGSQALEGSLNHASLGVIELPDNQSEAGNQTTAKPATTSNDAPGYVEESTTSRLSMTSQALQLWAQSGQSAIVGIGQGSFGASLHEAQPSHSQSSIVNNQYISVLTELGAVGLLAFVTLLGLPVYFLAKRRKYILVAILSAFYVQWLFFSGNINVIHIWVILGLAYAYSDCLRIQEGVYGD